MITITEVEWWIGNHNYTNSRTLAETQLINVVRAEVERKIRLYLEAKAVPHDWHEQCINFGEVLGEKADILLYPTKKNYNQALEILEGLTDAIAILAFVKSGVELFGTRYEAAFDGSSKT